MPLLLYLLWFWLVGHFTLELAVIGLLVTAALTLMMRRFFNWTAAGDIRILRSLPVFVLYLLNLIKEIAVAAFTVAHLALSHREQPDPVLVEFHSGFERESLNVLLANSITLTPGTITVFQQGDHFLVHALRKEYADGLEDSSFIHLLRRFP